MTGERFFLDTFFVQALLNARDEHHQRALRFLPRLQSAATVWVTEAVLVEVGNALSSTNRPGAAEFVRQCYRTPNIHVVTVDTKLLNRALDLYTSRLDKAWG